MSRGDKELIDLIVQSRMSFHYVRRKKYSEKKRRERDRLEDEFEALLKKLPKEQEKIIRKHEDQIFADVAKEDILYYRGGLRDGIRMKKFIHKLKGG